MEKDLSLGEMDLTLQISILQSLLSDFQTNDPAADAVKPARLVTRSVETVPFLTF